MLRAIMKTSFNRRDAKIFLVFSMLPFLVPILSRNIETISGNYLASCLSFIQLSLKTNYQILLPSLIFTVVVNSVFREEIDFKILGLYKDINRSKIFTYKLISLSLLQLVMIIGTMITSILTYYFFLVPQYGAMRNFLPYDIDVLTSNVLFLIAIILLNIVSVVLSVWLSIKLSSIKMIICSLLFSTMMSTAPLLVGLKYVSPLSYSDKLLPDSSFMIKILVVFLMSLFYLVPCYYLGKKKFKEVEF